MTSFPKAFEFTSGTRMGAFRFFLYRCGGCRSMFCVRSRLVREAPEALVCMDCGQAKAARLGAYPRAPKAPRFELVYTKAGAFLSLRKLA